MARRSKKVKDDRFIAEQNILLPSCIICDLDGTLALVNGRDIYDNSEVHTDLVNQGIKDLLYIYHTRTVSEVIYLSGRMDSAREVTEAWLKANRLWWKDDQKLYMRPHGDYRKDSIVKQELYEKYIKDKYYVNFILDDRDQVVKMWRGLGLLCLQVYYGDF